MSISLQLERLTARLSQQAHRSHCQLVCFPHENRNEMKQMLLHGKSCRKLKWTCKFIEYFDFRTINQTIYVNDSTLEERKCPATRETHMLKVMLRFDSVNGVIFEREHWKNQEKMEKP